MMNDDRIEDLTGWLERNALYAAEFDTRREALRAAQAALSVDPIAAIAPAKLSRVSAGEYCTRDGRWALRRKAKRWEITGVCAQPGTSALLSGGFETLHEAALMIAVADS